MLHVVAAIIERDGRILICRRTPKQSHPLKWEFPGGKVEPHESPEEALKLGWAHGALLTTFPGDTTMATLEEVRAFAKGGSARIQR